MSGEFWLIKDPEQLQQFCRQLTQFCEITQEPIKASYEVYKSPRTPSQNNAIHLYLEMLAKDLNNAGLDIQKTMSETWEIPWSPEVAKELIWRQVQTAMYPDKPSTTQLSTTEVNKVFAVIARHMAGKGITTPFPDRHGGQ